MKRWFYLNVSLLWLIALLIVLCLIGFVLYEFTSNQTFEALFRLLLVIEVIAAPVGMVAFGIWGENKIEKLEKEKE